MILYREAVCFFKKESFLENSRPGKLLNFANIFFDYLNWTTVMDQLTDDDKIGIVENLIHFSLWLRKESLCYSKIFLGFLDSSD